MNVGWQRAPALRVAVILACGILLQDILPFEPGRVLVCSLGCTTLLLFLSFSRWGFTSAIGPLLCLMAGVALAAGERLAVDPLPESLLGGRIQLVGTAVEVSRRDDRFVRVVFEDAWIVAESTLSPVRGAMVVSVARGESDPQFPELSAGMKVLARGTLYPIAGPRNPGEYDLRRWARANGFAGEVAARPPDGLVVLDSLPGTGLRSRVIFPLRRALLALIDRRIGGEEGELLKGLLIGERIGISQGVQDDFVRAGVAHVLAVSGSNVAVVAGFWSFLLSMTGAGRGVRSILLAVVLVGYMLLSGSQPPVVRATIMGMVALSAVAVGEQVNVLNALGVSALLLLAANSQNLFDVGFQLSFSAVLSLVILYPRLNRVIGRLQGRVWWKWIVRAGLRVMAVTLAATLGTLPLTAGVFGRFSLIGLLANVVVVPATGISVLLGGVTALLAPLSDSLCSLYSAANWGVLRFTLRFTHLCASPEWSSVAMPWFRAVHALPYAGMLCTIFSLGSPSKFRASLLVTFGLFVLVTVPAPPGAERGGIPDLRVTMLDVGQGDAILVDLPGGAHFLVDCGPAWAESDAGKRTVAPFLARQGIASLDLLVVTHEHHDHTGGFRSLIQSVHVRDIGAPAYLAERLSAEIGRRVHPFAMGEAIDLDPLVRCHVLSPQLIPEGPPNPGGNDGSLVLRLQFGSTALLLAGDAGFSAEEDLVERFGEFLHADGLKVAHHGSASSTGDRFLSAVRPGVALISAGRNNRFRHPAPATVEKLRACGARVFRTDLGGAVVLRSDGRVLTIER